MNSDLKPLTVVIGFDSEESPVKAKLPSCFVLGCVRVLKFHFRINICESIMREKVVLHSGIRMPSLLPHKA